MSCFDFDKDLASGQVAQDLVLGKLHVKYPSARQVPGNFVFWDIEVPEADITLEVKNDIRAVEKQRYYIETRTKNPWQPSGINTSKSDWWVIYDSQYLIWIKTPYLRILAATKQDRANQPPAGVKDAKVMWGVLITREELFNFIRANNCGKIEKC